MDFEMQTEKRHPAQSSTARQTRQTMLPVVAKESVMRRSKNVCARKDFGVLDVRSRCAHQHVKMVSVESWTMLSVVSACVILVSLVLVVTLRTVVKTPSVMIMVNVITRHKHVTAVTDIVGKNVKRNIVVRMELAVAMDHVTLSWRHANVLRVGLVISA